MAASWLATGVGNITSVTYLPQPDWFNFYPMRVTVAFLVWLSVLPAPAQSSANAPAAGTGSPVPAGVLLGVNLGTASSVMVPRPTSAFADGDGYRTFWVVTDGGTAKIVASLPEIVVPHGSGFWQLGATTVCEFDGTSNGSREVIWESPAGKTATVYQNKPCVRRKNVQNCGKVTATIRFASPSLIAEEYTQQQTDECEPRGGRWTTVDIVHKWGKPDGVDISEFLGEGAEAVYWQALQDGLADMRAEGMNCPPPEKEQTNLAAWSIAREGGAWHPVATANVDLGECEITHAMNAILPPAATADTSSTLFFRSAKQNQLDLRDLIVSPSGDWAVAVTERNGFQSFEVHEITAGQLGRKLLALDFTLPAGTSHFVSAQWAVGTHVSDWTATLSVLAEQSENKPKIVIDPARARDVFRQQ